MEKIFLTHEGDSQLLDLAAKLNSLILLGKAPTLVGDIHKVRFKRDGYTVLVPVSPVSETILFFRELDASGSKRYFLIGKVDDHSQRGDALQELKIDDPVLDPYREHMEFVPS